MPKKAKELSALAVSRLKTDGRHPVGGVNGLYLRVAGNSRAWVARLSVGTRIGKRGQLQNHRRDIGLGSYPEISLAAARKKAVDMRKQIHNGTDPIEQKKQARQALLVEIVHSKTFRDCAEVILERKPTELKNAKHLAQWRATLETYAYPLIGDRIVRTLTKADIVAVLEPIWRAKYETADRLRGRIQTILD